MPMLEGVRVLELSEFAFVPACAAVLADWGAEVVKVERPEGDPMRGLMAAGFHVDTGDFNSSFEHFNRNKRGVAIDLKHPRGRALLDTLVCWADVFVTNFRPAARRRLQIEPEDLLGVNPRLIYARGHGQGQVGPDAEAGGYDSVSYWSRGGFGYLLTPEAGPVIMQRGPMGDAPSGMFLAGGIAAALYQREKTGKGVVVDVSLLAAAVWTLGPEFTVASILEEEPARSPSPGRVASALVGNYQTRDRRWIVLTMLHPDRYWAPTCRALGRPDQIDQPEYDSVEKRMEHALEIRSLFSEIFRSEPVAHWEKRLSEEGCIYAKFASPQEVLTDPQVLANGYLLEHPAHPRAQLGSSPVQFDNEQIRVRRGAPSVGGHTDEVLRSLGISEAEIGDLRSHGAIA